MECQVFVEVYFNVCKDIRGYQFFIFQKQYNECDCRFS
jgi:hypothetical protein